MRTRRSVSVHSLLAFAGLVAAVPSAALAQAAGESAPGSESVSDQLNTATSLIADGKLARAKTLLTRLTAPEMSISLTDKERTRAGNMLMTVQRRLKSLGAADLNLQLAEDCLFSGDLKGVERHAQAIIDNPKATNEQSAAARELLAQADSRRAELQPRAAELLDAAKAELAAGNTALARNHIEAVTRAGLELSKEQSDLLAGLQLRVVEFADMPSPRTAAAGMLQPGVVKDREPAEPVAYAAPAPAPAPAPTPAPTPAPAAEPAPIPVASSAMVVEVQPEAAPQPADPIAQAQQSRSLELLTQAASAYDARNWNQAIARYNEVLSQYRSQLDASQISLAESRIAEARVQLGGAQPELLRRVEDQANLIRQETTAEFNQHMSTARRMLDAGNTAQAQQESATARVRIAQNNRYFGEAELAEFNRRVDELQAEIATKALEIQRAEDARRTGELARQEQAARTDAAQEKSRKIDEAINRARALQQEMRYAEALQWIDQVLFLDPINPAGLMLRDVIVDMLAVREWHQQQDRNHRSYVRQELDNQDALYAPRNIIDYPSDWPQISLRRGEPIAFAESEENRRVLAVLESKRIPVNFVDTPLSSVVAFVQAVTQLNVDVDWPSLENAGVDRERPVNLTLTNVNVKTALDRALEQVSDDGSDGAAWTVQDGVLTIASRSRINRYRPLVIYDIRDLLIEVPDYDNAPDFDLQSVLQSGEGGGQSPFQDDNDDDIERRTLEERTNEIIDIIQTNVDANGWQANGGDVGFIQQFQGNLIITNTPANHREIHGLLSKLRAVRAMQINVETRFLLVSQDYFEQIGFDIDVYFNAGNNQVEAARAGGRPNTRASDFFDFTRGGLQSQLPRTTTPAGASVTPRGVALPSPLSVVGAGQNSLGLAEGLTIGDFATEILGAAPALGVAGQFLDDIQVDFLIKATQADRRTVALTAPRLTFTNGQTSNIYVATQVAFVSDLAPVTSEGAVGFDPDTEVVSEGVVLTVDGTISADRRYVTLNVDAAVSRIDGFNNVPVTAVAGGQLVSSAETASFIQTPTVTVTRVQTTVTVPDQGTILLGGQRLVTESEVETGVPVLSKIPIINRFFTNRIQTKTEQTLLILLKPTILIQNEEEERAHPGVTQSIGGFSGLGG